MVTACLDQTSILRDCNWTPTHNPNGWVFVYELSGFGFESSCSHLNFRFHACSEQGVPWHSGNYRFWIHSETRSWHDKKIQSILLILGLSPLPILLPKYGIKYVMKSKQHAPLQFLKVILKNVFRRVALVDFAKHMCDNWLLYN